MNKKIAILLLSLAIILTGCSKKEDVSDPLKFKQEYESLNGQKDDEGFSYSTVEISSDCKVKYMTKDKITEVLTNGTHVVYFGWPTCPYCRLAVPILLETIEEYSGISMYYYDIKALRDAYSSDPNSEDGKLYSEIVKIISFSECDLSTIDTFEDGSLKLSASIMYFIKDGQIIGYHRGTVESHLNAYEPLEETQKEELKEIYRSYLDEMIKKSPIGCGDC